MLLDRRRFLDWVLRGLKATGLTLPFWSRRAHAGANASIYSGYHQNLVTGTTTVQDDWVRAATDACIKAMTGVQNIGPAWEAVFPSITVSSKVAIKVNCLNTNVYPQLATVKALVGGMTSMFNGTFPAGNISLFDNNLWNSGKVNACYGSSNLDALGIVHGEDTYNSGQTVSIGGTMLNISKYWADADYGISLAKMAPHQYYAGGLSGVIKNMMGALSTSSNADYDAKRNNSGFHDAAPYTAFRDLFTGYAKDNLHLYIVDMLFAARHENESGWAEVVKRITMGKDPCAVDAYNVDLINGLGMNVRKTVTKDVPLALESAGVGTTSYTLVEPTVSLSTVVPTRGEIEQKIKERSNSQATDNDVKTEIKKYREQ